MRLIAILSLWAVPAFADCPDPNLDAPRYAATGAGLIAPQAWDVEAGGTEPMSCEAWTARDPSESLTGFLPATPTAVFDLSGMGPHILSLRVRAQCEVVMIVRSADGLWYMGNATEDLTLWGASDAPLTVWVGTETGQSCPAELELETYDR